jgi:hypothetical protein
MSAQQQGKKEIIPLGREKLSGPAVFSSDNEALYTVR